MIYHMPFLLFFLQQPAVQNNPESFNSLVKAGHTVKPRTLLPGRCPVKRLQQQTVHAPFDEGYFPFDGDFVTNESNDNPVGPAPALPGRQR